MIKTNEPTNGSKISVGLMLGVMGLIITIWIYNAGIQTVNRELIADNSKSITENRVNIDMIKTWLTKVDVKLDRVLEQTK